MELQSLSCFPKIPNIKSSNLQIVTGNRFKWRYQRIGFQNAPKSYLMPDVKRTMKLFSYPSLNRGNNLWGGSNQNVEGSRNNGVCVNGFGGVEPFRGKSGSVSFHGLTHHTAEEAKLVSSPFKDGSGSLVWVLAPIALMASLVLPQFFFGNLIDATFQDGLLAEIVASFTSESIFYIGLLIFFAVVDLVQRPYLEFSPKRWGLITGLKGYLSSVFFTMGIKAIVPILLVYVTWPVLGIAALVAVAPFLVGCLVQYAFETALDKRGSSSWPLVPIIFEVYRLYQLSKAAQFIEKLMYALKDAPVSPELLDRRGALVAMIITFQVLGLVCLWSFLTFLLRLFPSRPVVENY